MNTAQIIAQLKRKRFQPPNGGPAEHLAWINQSEQPKHKPHFGKFGIPSYYEGTGTSRTMSKDSHSVSSAPSATTHSSGATAGYGGSFGSGSGGSVTTRSAPSGSGGDNGYRNDPQTHGMFTRSLTDSQLGNPQMGNPNNAGYRAAIKAAEAQGGTRPTMVDNTYKALGLGDTQRRALLGRNYVESGFDPNAIGDNGQALGLGQWHPDRIGDVSNFISGTASSFHSPAAQAAAIIHEMQTKYAGGKNRTPGTTGGAYGDLLGARDITGAMGAMNRFEAPRGYTRHGDPNRVTGYKQAMQYAQGYTPDMRTQVAGDMFVDPMSAAPEPQKEQGWGDYLASKATDLKNKAAGLGITSENLHKIASIGPDNAVSLARMFSGPSRPARPNADFYRGGGSQMAMNTPYDGTIPPVAPGNLPTQPNYIPPKAPLIDPMTGLPVVRRRRSRYALQNPIMAGVSAV